MSQAGGSGTRPYGGYKTAAFFSQGPVPDRPTQDSHRERWLGKARRSSGTATILNFANPGPGGPEGIADRHSDFSRRKFSV